MKVIFLLFFLLISGTQALSTSEFNMNFTSKGKSLIHSNGQAQELLGKLYGNIEDSKRLNDKVEETKNWHKEELINTTRKAQGGSSGGGGKRGKAGTGGSADVNRRPRPSSAPSLLSGPRLIYVLFVSLALIILFPFH